MFQTNASDVIARPFLVLTPRVIAGITLVVVGRLDLTSLARAF